MAKARKVHTVESLLARTVEEGECLLWTGYCANGVPMVDGGKKMVAVRRLLSELLGKETRKGYYTTNCGCKACVNPAHTIYRSQRQHMKAMGEIEHTMERRLRSTQAARRRDTVVLSIDIAREIRSAEGSQREIGERYGISKSNVSKIRRGIYWPEVSSPWAGLMR